MLATLILPEDVIEDLSAEIGRARAKFPKARNLNAALMEECGELARAQMQQLSAGAIRREAIQVMAVAFRIMTETDTSLIHDAETTQP